MVAVNAVSFSIRTVDELKKKWNDVKRGTNKEGICRAQRAVQEEEREMNTVPLSAMEKEIVSLMGEEIIFGFNSYVETTIPLVS